MDDDIDAYIDGLEDNSPIHCETCEGGYDPGADSADSSMSKKTSDAKRDTRKLNTHLMEKEEKISIHEGDNINIKANIRGGFSRQAVHDLLLLIQQRKCAEVTFVNGNEDDCKQIHRLIRKPLLYGRVPEFTFEKCCFGIETIRYLLELLTKPTKRLWRINFRDCCSSEDVNKSNLWSEVIQFAKTHHLHQLGVIGYGYDGLEGISVNFSSYMLIHFYPKTEEEVDYARRCTSEVEKTQTTGFQVSTYFPLLLRFIQEVDSLRRLDLSHTTLPGQAIVQICHCLQSMRCYRYLELSLGGWEESSVDAHKAVCELIKSGQSIGRLILADKINHHSYLSIEMLGNALSDSLYLKYFHIQFDSSEMDANQSLAFVKELDRLVRHPNRLKEISCECFYTDYQVQQTFRHAQIELNKRLGKMQAPQVVFLIHLIYGVTTLRNHLTQKVTTTVLNMDVIRRLAEFLF